MEKSVILVCSLVGFLGLLSAITAFAAEATRIKLNHVQSPSPSMCVYPKSPAPGLGLTSAIALLIAQIIISVVTGCFCCRRGPPVSKCKCALAVVCFIVSWIGCVLAILTLLTGATFSQQGTLENVYSTVDAQCYVLGAGVFTGGAILSIVSVFLGIFSYLASNADKNMNDPWRTPPSVVPISQSGIAMGHPTQVVQPPQNIPDPVFVHEDTYTRRQFV